MANQGRRLLDRVLAGVPLGEAPLTHAEELPGQDAREVPWPSWAAPEVVSALVERGVPAPWSHQAQAAELAWSGRDVVVATGTASGKSLAYQLPVLSALVAEGRATALYLSPTKALGADQIRAVEELAVPGVRAASFDGDTAMDERDWVRAHANWVFSNPDMLHRGVLPNHARWIRFFRGLAYVVVDECHAYRGVFGSHVALLLRRLRRVARRYGADPVFVLASATVAEPAASAERLVGKPCAAVVEDGSPRAGRVVALWEPPLLSELEGENGAPVRRSAGAETARILADLVVEGARSLAFVRSRVGAELTAMGARRVLAEVDPELPGRVAAYRGGYLPEERRALERALASGDLLGVATTNALELGVDIAGLDAVVVAGFPGTLASFWQQAGRAGRSGGDSLVVFVARDDPLDTYLAHHPEAVLRRPVEATVLDPSNPYVLAPHLACAAAELPLTEECLAGFGEGAREVVDGLVADRVLRRRPNGGWYWTARERPQGQVDIRGSGGEQVVVVEGDTGRVLGTVDPAAAHWTVHEGAVYLHQGESYVVDSLDLEAGIALVRAERPDWSTTARDTKDIVVVRVEQERRFAGVRVCLGEVEVTSQVVSYLRKLPSGQVVDQVPLDLPAQVLRTRAVWYAVDDSLLGSAPGGAGLAPATVPGALHAAEHAAIGLLPLFATCDRWDIGGVSTALHQDTGEATVFVHDGHPGGAGFADRGFAAVVPWLAAAREAISSCACPAGCPSCVQSPKCGNGNDPLDKAGGAAVLDVVLRAVENPPSDAQPDRLGGSGGAGGSGAGGSGSGLAGEAGTAR
ncbi:DEAD/DEAH box helicase [Actinosynnema mirum]|uniref:DEAD/DEAH box helicase domain protein n=1 Tax=Actinosynnema mirum (strain ATCC 29888 / DSM 43827 / JCM 3225 / NBRC 14064 / NCIMB 13271 / NRRL B-12336 / IMRU 3971 / 101) TaxID=446462 RepID=C6WFC0_ACTMD|nr:DEAD/DEAH box helicase [Actinosynnema mirum]ACU34252.1 DEAD/DEAH box helicase domain protein [Actinosynnema mirum DSM 43827]